MIGSDRVWGKFHTYALGLRLQFKHKESRTVQTQHPCQPLPLELPVFQCVES